MLGFSPIALHCQTYTVSGFVKDTDGAPLPYANVLLLRPADSVQFLGASSDESGFFRLEGVPPELYLLQPKYFGYQSDPVPLEVRADLRIGALVMKEDADQLDEVVVTSQRPTIERKADRVVFNVENTVLSSGSTWDILRNAPGVIAGPESLEIRGQAATIYLNDNKVQLSQEEVMELLKGLTGDLILSVEVIPLPPASFEASDGPILNIRTRQNIVPGYKGSVRGEYTQAVFPKYSLGTSHFFKNEKFGAFASYSIAPQKELKVSDSYINYIDAGNDIYARWDTRMDRIARSRAQQGNLILDYNPSGRDQLKLTANLGYSPDKRSAYTLATAMRNGQGVLDSTLRTASVLDEDRLNASAELNYQRSLGEKGATLKAGGHYTYFRLDRTQDGNTDYFDPSGAFLRDFSFATDAGQRIDIYTSQLDLDLPVGSGNLETGLRGSFIESRNAIDYLDVNNAEPPFDIALTDRFTYKEQVYAAYASLYQEWAAWSLRLGLRAEQTHVRARSETLDEINNQDYLELFPTLYLGRTLGEKHSMSLTYNRRLTRPNYQDLNPFRFFLNENDYNEGNPGLVPNFSHNFNLNLSLDNTYFIDLYYRDNGRFISTLSFQDNVNQTLLEIKQNTQGSISYGLDFTVSKTLREWWQLYAYNSLFYEEETLLAVLSPQEAYTNRVSGLYSYLSNSFTLSGDGTWTGDLSLLYLSGFLHGSFKRSETMTLDAGIRKSLWNGRAALTLVAEDLLGRANATYTSRYYNQDNAFYSRPETRFIRLGFTYNFGNYRLGNRAAGLRNSERDRIRED
ncbi:outer membrane beta-barrel protein [Robiginitalea sp. SC105]|nr:outer membrane beta-barrel protein [Robiginitalea sp. SC105]